MLIQEFHSIPARIPSMTIVNNCSYNLYKVGKKGSVIHGHSVERKTYYQLTSTVYNTKDVPFILH